MGNAAKWQSSRVGTLRIALILLCTLYGFSACQSLITTSQSTPPVARATTTDFPTRLPVETPTSTNQLISDEVSPAVTTLQVSLDTLCIYQTGESIPLSRADIYFSFRLYEPNGISHTIREVPQTQLIKHAADPTCAHPLVFGNQQVLTLANQAGTCLRIEGEFWNASRLGADALVGQFDEQVCYQRGQWLPIGEQSRHLTGSGADWEVRFTIQELSD